QFKHFKSKPVAAEMRREEKLCDALLDVSGVRFPVHKLVLCHCSSYFKALFTHWSSPDRRVFHISNVSADIMKVILDYCYTGLVHITEENLLELFTSADHFDVSGITRVCCRVMKEHLSPGNCVGVWRLTNMYYYPQLNKQVFVYILKHFQEVVTSSEEFLLLSAEELHSIIDEDELNVEEETVVFEAVLRWVAHAPQERDKHMVDLLPKVRLALLRPDYLTNCARSNSVLQNNRRCKAMLMETIRLMLDARATRLNSSLFPARLARPRLPRSFLVAIGGWGRNGPTNSIEVYNNRTDRWVGVANNNGAPRAYHGTVFLNGCVYQIGGFDGVYQFSTVHKYDLANRTWQEVAPMHSRRCYVSVSWLDGFIYAMGGCQGHVRLRTVERYSPETNQWTRVSPMNEARSDASSSAYNGKIYMCGGFNGEHCLDTAERYDPLTDQWTMIPQMSSRRSGLGVVVYGNEIYAVGGFSGTNRLNSAEAYNPSTNTWRPLPAMLRGRSNFGIEVVDGRLYVVGGYGGHSTIHWVECFDAKTRAWTEVRRMGAARSALSCSAVYDLPNMADYAARLTEEDRTKSVPNLE
uniref:BTB domain-containing protein n=1 Tax=Periophthalmus magnuspinnatus TaxID=409849 RepID=A0A3B4AF81_9GOBI